MCKTYRVLIGVLLFTMLLSAQSIENSKWLNDLKLQILEKSLNKEYSIFETSLAWGTQEGAIKTIIDAKNILEKEAEIEEVDIFVIVFDKVEGLGQWVANIKFMVHYATKRMNAAIQTNNEQSDANISLQGTLSRSTKPSKATMVATNDSAISALDLFVKTKVAVEKNSPDIDHIDVVSILLTDGEQQNQVKAEAVVLIHGKEAQVNREDRFVGLTLGMGKTKQHAYRKALKEIKHHPYKITNVRYSKLFLFRMCKITYTY